MKRGANEWFAINVIDRWRRRVEVVRGGSRGAVVASETAVEMVIAKITRMIVWGEMLSARASKNKLVFRYFP